MKLPPLSQTIFEGAPRQFVSLASAARNASQAFNLLFKYQVAWSYEEVAGEIYSNVTGA